MIKTMRKHLKNHQFESGLEMIEFIFVFPVLLLVFFSAIDIGYAVWQIVSFNYSMSTVSWDMPVTKAESTNSELQKAAVKEYVLNATTGLDPEKLTITQVASDPIIAISTKSDSVAASSSDTEKFGFNTKQYEYSYLTIKCKYQYEINWLFNFFNVFGGSDVLKYATGTVEETRSTGKDFYFTSS